MAASETARLIATLELKDLFTKTVDHAVKSLNKVDSKLDHTQSRAYRAGQQIGTGIRRGLALGIAAIGTAATTSAILLTKAVNAASDLNESVSKTQVVFGKSSASVLAFGKTAAASLGLSEQAADEAAATFGNLFVALKLPQAEAAKMSTRMVKLAADLASFNNVDPEEALLALRSGLVGETEPLRKFGVNLNDASLKAEALRLGLIKSSTSLADVKIKHDQVALAVQKANEATAKYGKGSTQSRAALIGVEKAQAALNKVGTKVPGVLDPAVKAQAAYSLILQQTKTAQGDVDRTAGGLANQMRFLKAQITDAFAALGKPVLPAVAKIFQRLNKEIAENQPAIAKLGDTIAGFVTSENIDKAFSAIGSTIETIKAAAPFLEASAKATLGFVQAAVSAFTSLPGPLQGLIAGGFAINKLTGGLLTNIAGGILGAVKGARGQTPAAPLYVADVTGGLGKAGGVAGAAGGGLLRSIGTLITKLGGLALVGGGLAAIGAGTSTGGPTGAAIAAGGGAATIAGGALLAGPLGAIAASIGVVGKTLLDIRDQSAHQGADIATAVQNQIAGGANLADLQRSLAAVNTGINDIQANPLNVLVAGDALDQLRAQRDALEKSIAAQESAQDRTRSDIVAAVGNAGAILDRGGRETGKAINLLAGKQEDDRQAVQGVHDAIIHQTDAILQAAKTARKPNDVDKAVKAAIDRLVNQGRGSVTQTQNLIKTLKEQLARTHDPKLQAAIRAGITSLEGKLPNRIYAQQAVDRANKILSSSRTTVDKIKALNAIETDLKDRKLPGQARALQSKIDALKRSQADAQAKTTAAANRTAEAIRRKNLSVEINNRIPINFSVNARTVIREDRIATRFYKVPI